MWNPVLADWENSGARRGQSPCTTALPEGCLAKSALAALYACWGVPSLGRSSLVLERQVAAKSMITTPVSPQLRGHLHGRPSLLSLGGKDRERVQRGGASGETCRVSARGAVRPGQRVHGFFWLQCGCKELFSHLI